MKNYNLRSKIKESIKKIFKITILLGIREIYLFFRNLYGLICHPFLTVKRIEKEKDFFQGILIFGLPGYFWLGIIICLAALRYLIGIRGNLGWMALVSLASITLISSLLLIYLLYWLVRTIKQNGGKR